MEKKFCLKICFKKIRKFWELSKFVKGYKKYCRSTPGKPAVNPYQLKRIKDTPGLKTNANNITPIQNLMYRCHTHL